MAKFNLDDVEIACVDCKHMGYDFDAEYSCEKGYNCGQCPLTVGKKEEDKIKIKVGDIFWEYNTGVAYPQKAHSEKHIEYFWNKYKKVTFSSLEELLTVYPKAIF